MSFTIVFTAVTVVAGAIASVTGFGIGSLLTPLLALETGAKVAVAAVAIPHVLGTAVRFWNLRRFVDRRVLLGFGITSAIGGLIGALLHARLTSHVLAIVFGALLLAAGIAELTGWVQHRRWGRSAAWVAGALSGALGGLVGNQGGIRSAAMLGFDVPRQSFVATATAIALFVDGARLPVYLATEWSGIARIRQLVFLGSIGVVVGTLLGARVLSRIDERTFRRVLAWLLLVLGVYMIVA